MPTIIDLANIAVWDWRGYRESVNKYTNHELLNDDAAEALVDLYNNSLGVDSLATEASMFRFYALMINVKVIYEDVYAARASQYDEFRGTVRAWLKDARQALEAGK